jgi:uncharacterized protein
MTRFGHVMRLTAVCALSVCAGALFLVAPPAAQGKELASAPTAQGGANIGEKVEIEIVTFGPGLHMLRDDTSPVKDRIKAITEKTPSISFKACGNTQDNMHKAEHKEIPLISQATLVKSGVVRVMELQEEGWTYVRP